MKPIFWLAGCLVPLGLTAADIPHLHLQGSAQQLIVGGQPFLIRGGEVSNSQSEPDHLRPLWPKFKALNLNTLVVPVDWDVIEPVEGHFDFASVDGLVADARANDLRLVLLWFGSWKNSMSCYAPAWVKSDSARFPRARNSAGQALEVLTPFDVANRDADARSFMALMRHLRETDGMRHTVVLVQVENEMGMIPEARDRSPPADAAFAGPVPGELIDYLAKHREQLASELREQWLARGARTNGGWTEVFGAGAATDELFMAWAFGRYVQTVAAAGKAEYPLPMYANAALIRPGYQPGRYPAGGPLPQLMDVWRAAAPALDFLSPDIYFPNFTEWADRYTRSGNPLFIPEALRSPEAAANCLYAFGARDAVGFSPFGIEAMREPAAGWLKDAYDLVRQLTPLIAGHQGRGTMTALVPPTADPHQPQKIGLGGWVLRATYEPLAPPALADGVIDEANDRSASSTRSPTGAIVIELGPDELLFGGCGVTVTFAAPSGDDSRVGILNCEEGHYDEGRWRHLRWLNGDQTHQGRHIRLEPGRFALQRVKLYRYR